MKKTKKLTRRKFVCDSAKGAAGFITYSLISPKLSKAAGISNADNSKVVVVTDENASQLYDNDGNKIYFVDQEVVQIMVDNGIKELTGIQDIGEAWKSLFPGITNDKKISIKVNCIAGTGLTSHPEVAYSIAHGLATSITSNDGGMYSPFSCVRQHK